MSAGQKMPTTFVQNQDGHKISHRGEMPLNLTAVNETQMDYVALDY